MGMGPGMGPGAAPRLALTQEQVDKFRPMDEAFRQEIGPLRDELFAKRDEMRQLWASPNADAASIAEKKKELQALQAQLQEKGFQHQLQRREVLTPEQREKLGTFGPGPGMGSGRRCGGPGFDSE
jgi:Spy/CpxP family protein refolding chaperone